MLLLRSLPFLFFVLSVHACGVTQHNYIAHRALNWFSPSLEGQEFGVFLQIIQNNQDAFQNGAAFPDWGYACGDFGDESEAAHWPPFTLACSKYVFDNCGPNPSNWTRDCEKLGAFLFGMVSHQVADVLWHDLAAVHPSYQGFIQSMANIDFGGKFSDAHHIADTGAEFVIAREFDLSFIKANWYLPADALSTIYQSLRYPVNPDDLRACNLLLYSEVHAVKEGGAALYDYAAKQSPFLVDQLLDYWMGGVDDNAIWTNWCWSDYFIHWLAPSQSDIDTGAYPLCLVQKSLFSDCERCNPEPLYEPRSPLLDRLAKELIELGLVQSRYSDDGNSVYFTSDQPRIQEYFKKVAAELEQKVNLDIQQEHVNDRVGDSCISTLSNAHLVLGNPNNLYGYAGKSFAAGDLNGDHIDDLIIGIPGYSTIGFPQQGGVYIYYGSQSLTSQAQNETLPEIPTLVGKLAHDRFGWASAVIDFNHDGINDIVVSSPTTSAKELTYLGEISVFFGRTQNSSYSLPLTPDITFYTNVNYTNLGQSFLVYDCDMDGFDDLLVNSYFAGKGSGTPQQMGKIHLLLSSSSYTSGNQFNIEKEAFWILGGSSTNVWFGKQTSVWTLESSTRLLLVGAPMFNSKFESSTSEYGAIYAYDLDALMTNGGSTDLSQVFSITGSNLWDQTGFSFSVGPMGSYSSVLALSAPASKDGFDKEQEGLVYLIDISTLKGTYDLNSVDRLTVLKGNEKYARFGHDSVFVQESPGNYTFWITEPRKSAGEFIKEAGFVYQWQTDKLPSRPDNPFDSCNKCYASQIGLIRYGESVLFADLDGSGAKDVIVGSPRWNDQLLGAFTILYR